MKRIITLSAAALIALPLVAAQPRVQSFFNTGVRSITLTNVWGGLTNLNDSLVLYGTTLSHFPTNSTPGSGNYPTLSWTNTSGGRCFAITNIPAWVTYNLLKDVSLPLQTGPTGGVSNNIVFVIDTGAPTDSADSISQFKFTVAPVYNGYEGTEVETTVTPVHGGLALTNYVSVTPFYAGYASGADSLRLKRVCLVTNKQCLKFVIKNVFLEGLSP